MVICLDRPVNNLSHSFFLSIYLIHSLTHTHTDTHPEEM